MPQRRGKKCKTNEFLSQLISHSAPSANILWPHPFVKLFPQRHWLPQRQPTALRFYTFGPFVVGFFVAAAAVALSSLSSSLPSLPLALSTVAVRFLFRLVASPLAYQKVTYLTRHKWKSKRLISSSFSSTVCLCLPPFPYPQILAQIFSDLPTYAGRSKETKTSLATWKSAGKAPFRGGR